MLQSAKKLRWIQTVSAGVDGMRWPELIDSSIVLTNAKIVMGPNIADHSFALLLALTRGIGRAAAERTQESWSREPYFGSVELAGKTAVIVGVGGIGMQIAQRARGFGMGVIGVDPKDIPLTPLLDKVVTPDRLDEVLPQADVVFVSAPLTVESKGMIGDRQFGLMKKKSYFVAVSRGGLYQTPALVKALDSGHLAGAGLDVTDPEPLPKGHALWKFPNVVITPHTAGQGDLMPKRRMEMFKENIRRFLDGRPMLNVVDKAKGY
jgi:phosphoglycerate dehydrogenase-like enzyme